MYIYTYICTSIHMYVYTNTHTSFSHTVCSERIQALGCRGPRGPSPGPAPNSVASADARLPKLRRWSNRSVMRHVSTNGAPQPTQSQTEICLTGASNHARFVDDSTIARLQLQAALVRAGCASIIFVVGVMHACASGNKKL